MTPTPKTYKVTFRPEGDPRRAAPAPVTRKLTVVHVFTETYPTVRHYIKFAGVRGYGEYLEAGKIVRIEEA